MLTIAQILVRHFKLPKECRPLYRLSRCRLRSFRLLFKVQDPEVQVAPPAPQMAQESQPEVQSLSKTELMRRERTREELKNEDILQERLEELRLRDEKRRTDQLLGTTSQDPNAPVAPIAGLANQQVLRAKWL